MISRYYKGEQFDVETFFAMQVAAFCTSRETLSNPQNLQDKNVIKIFSDERKWTRLQKEKETWT